ncbi:hypothetical protein D3C81_1000710 [compost metagenome]
MDGLVLDHLVDFTAHLRFLLILPQRNAVVDDIGQGEPLFLPRFVLRMEKIALNTFGAKLQVFGRYDINGIFQLLPGFDEIPEVAAVSAEQLVVIIHR